MRLGARWLVVDSPIRNVDCLLACLFASVWWPGITITIIRASAALRLGTSSKVSRDEPEATESRAAANSSAAEFCVPQLHLRTWTLLMQLPSCIIITRGKPSQGSSGGWRSGCSHNPYHGVRRALFRVHPAILCQRGFITHSSVAFLVAAATVSARCRKPKLGGRFPRRVSTRLFPAELLSVRKEAPGSGTRVLCCSCVRGRMFSAMVRNRWGLVLFLSCGD